MNAIARQIQIDLITDTPNEIITWFNDLWSQLNVIESNVYHKDGGEYIYYVNEDNKKIPIFFQDDKNDRFWCDHYHYWSIVRPKFNLDYNDIQAVTQLLVEHSLNCNIITPILERICEDYMIDNVLNNITND